MAVKEGGEGDEAADEVDVDSSGTD